MATETLIVISILIALGSASADSKNNPADDLVSVINQNRTAHKSSSLADNPGLGCMALQYIKAYDGNCDEVGGSKAKKACRIRFC